MKKILLIILSAGWFSASIAQTAKPTGQNLKSQSSLSAERLKTADQIIQGNNI
jgi:hypothetical protein